MTPSSSIRSSIDLGTNTCLLLVVDWDEIRGEIRRVLGDFSTIVRLGEGVDQHRELQPAAMKRTEDCLKDYAAKLRELGGAPDDTYCVATSSSRDSKNGAQFFARIEKEIGFHFRVISGDEEAKLTFLGGLLPDTEPSRSVVIDIGGGSTELISEKGGRSLDIGSVRFTERFFKSQAHGTAVTDEEFWRCQDAVDSEIQSMKEWRSRLSSSTRLVAVAGTATTLAAWHLGLEKFDAAAIDQCVLTRGDLHRMVEELKWRTIPERAELPGMEAKRADVILAGALILWRAAELLEFPEVRVSTRGLRFGALKAFS